MIRKICIANPRDLMGSVCYIAEIRTHYNENKDLCIQTRQLASNGSPDGKWITTWTHPNTPDSPDAMTVMDQQMKEIREKAKREHNYYK